MLKRSKSQNTNQMIDIVHAIIKKQKEMSFLKQISDNVVHTYYNKWILISSVQLVETCS